MSFDRPWALLLAAIPLLWVYFEWRRTIRHTPLVMKGLALLAIALEGGSDRQKRVLAWWIIGFCLLSIVISIGESATQTHLIPVNYGDEVDANTKKFVDDVSDFRGDGLFGHPLTAAFTASMATFLLLRMQMNPLLKGSLFTAMLIGLLSFGGRAAL